MKKNIDNIINDDDVHVMHQKSVIKSLFFTVMMSTIWFVKKSEIHLYIAQHGEMNIPQIHSSVILSTFRIEII